MLQFGLPLLFLGFVDADRGGEVVRAPDRSNRSHLGSRPRPLVGRGSAGSGAQHPSYERAALKPLSNLSTSAQTFALLRIAKSWPADFSSRSIMSKY